MKKTVKGILRGTEDLDFIQEDKNYTLKLKVNDFPFCIESIIPCKKYHVTEKEFIFRLGILVAQFMTEFNAKEVDVDEWYFELEEI